MIWTPDQKLLALSWKQPYGEMMLHDKVETRTWKTAYRGWVLICASKQPYRSYSIIQISGLDQLNRMADLYNPSTAAAHCGHAIAIGYLSDCYAMRPSDENDCFVAYQPDLCCHVYREVHKIKPFPWKGTQGWKEVSPEIKNQIQLI